MMVASDASDGVGSQVGSVLGGFFELFFFHVFSHFSPFFFFLSLSFFFSLLCYFSISYHLHL